MCKEQSSGDSTFDSSLFCIQPVQLQSHNTPSLFFSPYTRDKCRTFQTCAVPSCQSYCYYLQLKIPSSYSAQLSSHLTIRQPDTFLLVSCYLLSPPPHRTATALGEPICSRSPSSPCFCRKIHPFGGSKVASSSSFVHVRALLSFSLRHPSIAWVG